MTENKQGSTSDDLLERLNVFCWRLFKPVCECHKSCGRRGRENSKGA